MILLKTTLYTALVFLTLNVNQVHFFPEIETIIYWLLINIMFFGYPPPPPPTWGETTICADLEIFNGKRRVNSFSSVLYYMVIN